jgi:hypothetical protein
LVAAGFVPGPFCIEVRCWRACKTPAASIVRDGTDQSSGDDTALVLVIILSAWLKVKRAAIPGTYAARAGIDMDYSHRTPVIARAIKEEDFSVGFSAADFSLERGSRSLAKR